MENVSSSCQAKPNLISWSSRLARLLWAPFSHSSGHIFLLDSPFHSHIQVLRPVSPFGLLNQDFILLPVYPDARVCTRMPNRPYPQPPLFGTILCEGHCHTSQAMADGRADMGKGHHTQHTAFISPAPTHPWISCILVFSEISPHTFFPWLHSSPSLAVSHISSHGPASPPHCFTAGVLLDPAVYFLLHPHIRCSELIYSFNAMSGLPGWHLEEEHLNTSNRFKK